YPASPCHTARSATTDLCAARGRRTELPRSRRSPGDIDWHGDEPAALRPAKTPPLSDTSVEVMIEWNPKPDNPTPEQLAAYADRELEPAARQRIEAWLANHPEAAADMAAVQRLSSLWHAAAPPEPHESSWREIVQRVHAGVQAAAAKVVTRRPRRGLRWGMAFGAAAAVLLAMALAPLWRKPASPNSATGLSKQEDSGGDAARLLPFPVAAADDVDIISIEEADVNALVVGDPPVRGVLKLAAAEDVSLESVDPAPGDGMVPWVGTQD